MPQVPRRPARYRPRSSSGPFLSFLEKGAMPVPTYLLNNEVPRPPSLINARLPINYIRHLVATVVSRRGGIDLSHVLPHPRVAIVRQEP